jgi:hypothetical protein
MRTGFAIVLFERFPELASVLFLCYLVAGTLQNSLGSISVDLEQPVYCPCSMGKFKPSSFTRPSNPWIGDLGAL